MFKLHSTLRTIGTLSIAGAALAIALAANPALAKHKKATEAAKGAAVDSSHDGKLKTFLQRQFKIPNADWIKIGAPETTGIAGLYSRALTIVNDQGQTVGGATIYVNQAQTAAIVGQYLDLTSDPWAKQDMSKIGLDDHPVLGNTDAPVTVVEFADFECPHCAHAFSGVEALVNSLYKDKIKVIYKYFPLAGHQWAFQGAEAAECARMQNPDAFWPIARFLYGNQAAITPLNLMDRVSEAARDQNLDVTALKACMSSPQVAARVKQDMADGAALKVTSTPTFFVDGIRVIGMPGEAGFAMVIDSELKRAGAAAAR